MNMAENPSVYRLVIEIRFQPSLSFSSSMMENASALEGYFEEWEASYSPQQILMFSKQKNEAIRITNGLISRTFEKPTAGENAKEAIEEMFSLFILPSEVQQIRRIGVRSGGIYKLIGNSEDLVNSFYEAFYSKTEIGREISGDSIQDVALVLDGIKNGFKNHLRFGPITEDQLLAQFGQLSTKEVKINNNANIYLDLDVFIDKLITIDESTSMYKKIIDENLRQASEWSKAIKNQLK